MEGHGSSSKKPRIGRFEGQVCKCHNDKDLVRGAYKRSLHRWVAVCLKVCKELTGVEGSMLHGCLVQMDRASFPETPVRDHDGDYESDQNWEVVQQALAKSKL